MSDPDLDTSIPNIPLNISVSEIRAKPRTLRMEWSTAAAQDLWGVPFNRPTNPLDLLKDALDDPDYDPDAAEPYEGLYRWPDGRVATPEELKKHLRTPEAKLAESMADEMTAEIDREILRDLRAASDQ